MPEEAFELFSDQPHAEDSVYTTKIHYLLKPEGSIAGVDAGDDVTMFGRKIGSVDDARIAFDSAAGRAEAQVEISIEPGRLAFTDIDARNPNIESQTASLFQRLAAQKLRAEFTASNLLTGKKQIDFTFVEDAPPAAIRLGGKYPEFPSHRRMISMP